MLWQGPLRFLVPAALLAIAALMTANLIGEDDRKVPESLFAAVYADVCAAASAADAGDREAAERHFVDEAHAPLHDLAAAAGTRDRGAAGRLLEAKQRVEAAVEAGVTPNLELTGLVSTTRRAVEVADERDPGACT